MSWSTLGTKLDSKSFRKSIADSLAGQTRRIAIGRSSNVSGFANNTPIEIVDGDDAPQLIGQPYLSTTFRRGSFTKNMYTPSTLRVVVGRNWKSSN